MMMKKGMEQDIQMIVRQTTYTYDEACNKYLSHKQNVEDVLKEYLGVVEKEPHVCKTSNQERFRLIREVMDDASKSHYKNIS